MNRLTATVARAHLNAIAWQFEEGAKSPTVEGTRVALALTEIQKDFEGITVKIGEEDYVSALLVLHQVVTGWEGHDYGLDDLGAALTIYGNGMAANEIGTTAREILIAEARAVIIKAKLIAGHSS